MSTPDPLAAWLAFVGTKENAPGARTTEATNIQVNEMNTITTAAACAHNTPAVSGCDEVSVLRHATSPLTKTWCPDGEVRSYGGADTKPKYFSLERVKVEGIRGLSILLRRLETDTHACLIRGRYVGDDIAQAKEPEFKPGKVLRRNSQFDDQPLHTVLIEVDGFEPITADPVLEPVQAIEEYIATALPEPFLGVSYHWQMSSRAGHPSKAGKLAVHIWFWLATARTSAELAGWAKAVKLAADTSVLEPIQIHYTAAPIFEEGVSNPVPVRSGFVEGLCSDDVDLQISPAVLAAAAEKTGRKGRDSRQRTPAADDLADFILEHWEVRGETPDGDGLHIQCPNEAEHTSDTGPSSSTYFLNGTGGYSRGYFICKHAHCKHLTGAAGMAAFEDAIGYILAQFEDLGALSPEEEAEQAAIRARNRERAKRLTHAAIEKLRAPTAAEVIEKLRQLDRDAVLGAWLADAVRMGKGAAHEVVEEVSRLTGRGRRVLGAALAEAKAEAAQASKNAQLRERAGDRQLIQYRPEDRTEQAREVETAIVRAAKPGEYVAFGGLLSHVALKPLPYTHLIDDEEGAAPPVPQIEPLGKVAVLGRVEKVAAFYQVNEAGPSIIAVPDKIVDILIDKPEHAAPQVSGLVTHPIVLRTGEILADDGLHEGSGLFLSGAAVAGVKPYTQDEAREALLRLRSNVLEGFEFASELDADVALAGLFTGVQRRVLDMAPGLGVLASTQSSGKTTLARRIHVLLTGRDMPVSTFPQGDEAEVQKRLLSLLLRSPAMVCFDNITDGTTFRSGAIAAAMTGPSIEQRVLGLSRDANALTNVLFVMTGNNLSLGPDEVTRWMVARLAPNTARPEERTFKHPDVVAHAMQMRASVLRDVVGIVAGFVASGAAMETRSRFARWDRMVRQPMLWAGAADVAEVFKRNTEGAEHVLALESLLTALHEVFGGAEFLASDVVAVVKDGHAFARGIAGERLRALGGGDVECAEVLERRLASALENLRVKDIRSSRSVARGLAAQEGRAGFIGPDGARLRAEIKSRVSRGERHYRVGVAPA